MKYNCPMQIIIKSLFCLKIEISLHCSLERGKAHALYIPAVDNDDDLTECGLSAFIEAGVFVNLLKNLTDIIKMNGKVSYKLIDYFLNMQYFMYICCKTIFHSNLSY